MNQLAQKCAHCRKAFKAGKIDQQYCSNRCRQAAYRKRKPTILRREKRGEERPLHPTTCLHCGGTFWAKSGRSVFCSTSCRTLHHRALKAALPDALSSLYGIPIEKAVDVVDTQPTAKIREVLATAGYIYNHPERQWVVRA
jgi:hypothetical protein